MLILFAALLPCLVWDSDPGAPSKLGIEHICPAAQTAVKLPAPGVEYRMNEASASRSPWLTGNGWRIQRAGKAQVSYDVKDDAAALAAVEAFAYGADALIHTDPKGLTGFAQIIGFLKTVTPANLAPMANIGVQDDGGNEMGELMNLLARHNLLFRIVQAPDPHLDLNVRVATADANRLSHQIRSQLTDEKRLLRIYGSEVVIGRLTGDSTRARLHLIDYAKRPVDGLRVRVLGSYARHEETVSGIPGAKLQDYTADGTATEFTLPQIQRYAVIDLYSK